jgi:hypothetical protein
VSVLTFLLGVTTGAFAVVLPSLVRANAYDIRHFGDLWREAPDAHLRPWLRWVRRTVTRRSVP